MPTNAPADVLEDFHDDGDTADDFRQAVLNGLSQPQKRLPSKFFYDARGSALFDEICTLDEYYPTRTETALLESCGKEIAVLAGPDANLIEFGSGSSVKTRILLDALDRLAAYVPLDISRDHLLAAAKTLAEDYPDIAVTPVCADFVQPLDLPKLAGAGVNLGFFPGSTIGNFRPADAAAFLKNAARSVGPGGAMVIGVDLIKDPATLHAAYNDARDVTAAFNLNLLERINRELDADFDLDGFSHYAPFNPARGCIEMHLVSRRAQKIQIAGETFAFAMGESIHTEDSHKYTIEGFQELARRGGWSPRQVWCDADDLFSVHFLDAA
ncbi:MAG: L-histidine N(alpha)-methyltransferase [Minwuiales bacterium]|nr:L-histidine N(alpha)-methyltransferase [Minwuiales bacterium]